MIRKEKTKKRTPTFCESYYEDIIGIRCVGRGRPTMKVEMVDVGKRCVERGGPTRVA